MPPDARLAATTRSRTRLDPALQDRHVEMRLMAAPRTMRSPTPGSSHCARHRHSEPDHWQSIWERRYPGVTRVLQRDWDQPVCSEWAAAVEEAVATSAQPPVIVAHSLGCLAVAHWAFGSARKVAGLVLVAVPDPEGPNFRLQRKDLLRCL
jgi:predicted alpha/beta hydrolase family esterase